VVARIGPMLGLLPETANAPAIAQSLAIPLVPGRPAGATPARPAAPPAAARPPAPATPQTPATAPAVRPTAPAPARDPRQEAAVPPTQRAGGSVVAVR
jgi:hypothetical protein